MLAISFTALIDGQGVVLWYAGHLGQLALICLAIEELCISSFRLYSCFSLPIMRVVVLLVLLVVMSITPPTLAVTATTTAATTTVVSSSSSPSSSSSSSSGSECDPSYPDVCLPTPPPDLNCTDITSRRFEVVGSDPHALDGDNNGIACEGPPLPVPPIPLQAPPPQQQEAQEQQEQNQTETQNLPTSTTTPFITNATTKKTDGLLTASINGTRFTTDQIISIDGMVAGGDGAGAGGMVFIELRDPHNAALLYDSANMTTTGTSDTPFSYSLVAGKLLENAGGSSSTAASAGDNKRVVKPMNETGSNYTLLVRYDDGGTGGDATSASNDDITTTSSAEVQFNFAYEHVSSSAASSSSPPPSPPRQTEPEFGLPDAEPQQQQQEEERQQRDEQEERLEEQEELIDDQQSRIEDLEDEQSRLEGLLEEAREDAEGRLQKLLDEQEERADDDDDDDDSRNALEILKDVLNREPSRDVDEDDD
jgi:hypothetical protein